jgi:protein SCO1/2
MRVIQPIVARLLACALLLGSTITTAQEVALKAGVFDPPRQAPDFALPGSNGDELKLSTYLGKVVVLGFGFTSCPDVCPATLAVLAQARKKLAAQAGQMQVIYITVDPARDTPEQMRKYLGNFDPTFIGGTGTVQQLNTVRQNYGIVAERKEFGASYTMAHSSFVYLIDRTGKLRALMPYGHSADDYAHDVRALLAK